MGVEKVAQPCVACGLVVKYLGLGEDIMEMYCTIIIETWAGAPDHGRGGMGSEYL